MPARQLTKSIFLISLLIFIQTGFLSAQDSIPAPPNPPRLVNDFARILTPEQVQTLEQKLVAFNDSTSTQIAVVTVSSLAGYDPADYTQRLGQKWGVGGAKFNNGIVILIKPKTAYERGEAFIAPGYGIEPTIPDATAWDIMNNEMIPRFKQNDYYGGIDAAVNTIFKFTSGEFKASNYGRNKKGSPGIVIVIILFIIAFFFFTRGGRNNRNISSRSSSSALLWPLLLGGIGGGNWGGGGGSSGGGGGGFGGFGGGGFGGGGAGGSW